MAIVAKRRKKPVGAAPGSVVYVGIDKTTPVSIERIRYTPQGWEPPTTVSAQECRPPQESDGGVTWYTVTGVHNVELLKTIGENFGLHPLVVEDISNTTQRPKLEGFDGYFFIAAKMITFSSKTSSVDSEHVSIVYGKGFVLTFLQDPGDVFAPVRQRIESGKGRIRRLGSDYLVYALLDAIVDYYFQVIEGVGETLEALEEEVISRPTTNTLNRLHKLKREIIALRRSVWPMREIVNSLVRDESPFITADVRIFLRDLYDHTIQVIDTVETLRDIIAGTLDVYLSSVSNKLNQVMKVLTVMSSIFIPLTFIVGVYGMNFHYMPELEWRLGYPAVWLLIVTITVGLLGLFKKKQWL